MHPAFVFGRDAGDAGREARACLLHPPPRYYSLLHPIAPTPRIHHWPVSRMAPRRLSLQETLDGIEAQFALEKKDLLAILKRFRNQMDHGLANDGQDMAMIPTFGAF